MLASRILERSLRLIGVLQAAEAMDAEDAQDALDVLNGMLEAWRLDSLLVYARLRYLFALTAGQAQYTVGVGGQFNIERPVRIEDARYVTNSGPQELDTPLPLLTDAQYRDITQKALPSSWALWAYYDPTYPLGTFVLWPAPSLSNRVRLTVWQPLSTIPTIETEVDLPPGYRRAIEYNVAREMAPEYGVTLAPGHEVLTLAMESKEMLMRLNAQPMLLHTGMGQGRYNHLNDEYR